MSYSALSKFSLGKFEDYPVWVVACCEASYIEWCIKETSFFCLDNIEEVAKFKLVSKPGFSYKGFDESEFGRAIKESKEFQDNPDLLKTDIEGNFMIYEWLNSKGLDFYFKYLHPILNQKFLYSEEILNINHLKLEKLRADKEKWQKLKETLNSPEWKQRWQIDSDDTNQF